MSGALNFLVVDDQSITRRIIIALLKGLGHTAIAEAENGQKALDLLQAGTWPGSAVNFVITDWEMPVMNGLTLLRTIRKNSELQQLPVLMVTSKADMNHIDTVMQSGADGFIDKQLLNLGMLKEMIENILLTEERMEKI